MLGCFYPLWSASLALAVLSPLLERLIGPRLLGWAWVALILRLALHFAAF